MYNKILLAIHNQKAFTSELGLGLGRNIELSHQWEFSGTSDMPPAVVGRLVRLLCKTQVLGHKPD